MKRIYLFAFIMAAFGVSAQKISSNRWSDLFSYNNVLQIREDQGKLIAATENGIFYYTPSTGEISKLSKANGLHEVKISAFDYNPETKIGLVGYENGTMDVITPDGITFIVDIPLATGYTGSKRINHISISGNLAVISVGYGVSLFRLDKKEFGDTAFFGASGSYDSAKEAVIFDNKVFAVTNSGLKSHEINVSFPINSTWTQNATGTFSNISASSTKIGYTSATQVFVGDGISFSPIPQAFTTIKDLVIRNDETLVATSTAVSIFNASGAQLKTKTSTEELNTGWFSNSQLFLGSKYEGLLNESDQKFKPSGPYFNTSYKISLVKDKILVSSGARGNNLAAPIFMNPNRGFYYFDGSDWIFPSFFKNNPARYNIIDAVSNPLDLSETFIASYNGYGDVNNGFLQFNYNSVSKDFEFVKLHNLNRRTWGVGLEYDEKGNLFGTSQMDEKNIGVASTFLYLYDRSSQSFIQKQVAASGAQKPFIKEGIVWIPTSFRNYFVAVDLNNSPINLNDDKVYEISVKNGLPANSEGSIGADLDQSGDLWIGTTNGLRILHNAVSAISDPNLQVDPIIIEENGIGEELFRDGYILQIEADSGNQKWVSVNNGGVFYLSSNGERTINHFTKENSPLPTNNVTDVKVDEKTGKVYFVTLDGIVVYQGDVANVSSNFGDVLVYPNPVVYANYKGNVRIKGLAEKTNIRITDAAGNLVHQAVSRGGFYEWDLTNRGKRVASGIYFVLMTNADGTDKATAKIAVVN